MTGRDLAVAVAGCTPVTIAGEFQRHASLRWPALSGSNSGGRWGKPGTYPVLYLGRPEDSVIVEAYRHLVDDIEGMRRDLVQPRRLITCVVKCTHILDLRQNAHRARVGLADVDLMSRVGDYEPCQRVAAVAHQLGLHGIIAPSAGGIGETLALFEEHLSAGELPTPVGKELLWDGLPADPRRPGLRLIRSEEH